LPTEDLVKVDSENDMHILDFLLALPYASIPARVYNLKVVLPEGAVFVDSSFNSTQITNSGLEFTNTLLNFVGRPTVSATFDNFVSPIEMGRGIINYSFKGRYFFIAPSYLAVGAFAMFMIAIMLNRIDFDFKLESEREKEKVDADEVENELVDKEE